MKNQKNSGFFWFFAWIVVTCLLKICPKTKKDLSCFGFFSLISSKSSFKKPNKPWFFLVCLRSWPKKTKKTRGKQKKQTWASDQTFSEKFWFFGFLVFSRFFGFPHGLSPKEKSNSWLVPLNLKRTKKPKNQNFSENVWCEAHVWFFWVFLEFFLVFFGHDLEKLKKKLKVF